MKGERSVLRGQASTRHAVRQRLGRSDIGGHEPEASMDEQPRFRAFGCSECAWVFNPSGSATGNSLSEAMRNFELQHDRKF
jgi:hypothetical protein